jgi:hypothetical protein
MLMTKTTFVQVTELKRLLTELKDLSPDTCIRFRFIGEMWQSNHCRVIKLTEKGVVLNDEKSNKLIFLQDIKKVIQFELDQGFQHYQPHFHYTVDNE